MGASLVLGAVVPVPVRCLAAQEYLAGKEICPETAEKAADLALKGADPLEETSYKVQVAKTLVKQSILNLR